MSAPFQQALLDYSEGRRSVQDVVRLVQAYEGPAPHLLWVKVTRPADEFFEEREESLFEYCLRQFSQPKLARFLRELIRANPGAPAITRNGESFLHVALGHFPEVPSGVLLPLCVPEITSAARPFGETPLVLACHIGRHAGDGPYGVFGRLIKLDPDALVHPGLDSKVPLHHALQRGGLAGPAVAHMAAVQPDALLCRDRNGETPVEYALRFAHEPSLMLAQTLRHLVALRPPSVVFPPQSRTRHLPVTESALYWACQRFYSCADLVDEIVRADPTALLLASSRNSSDGILLPFEAAAAAGDDDLAAAVQEKTVYMALAVVEYVLGGAAIDDDDDEEQEEADQEEEADIDDVTAFQIRVRDTVDSFLRPAAPADRAGSSGFEVARAVGELDNAIDVVRELFCRDTARGLLRESAQFRSAVMGDVVADLYRLNCMGRFGDGSASHQVELLASLQDSATVESTFLHFREVAHNVLLPLGVRGEEKGNDADAARSGN
jgi:hypothetical protein